MKLKNLLLSAALAVLAFTFSAPAQPNATAPVSTVGQYVPTVINLGFTGFNATNLTLTTGVTNIVTNTVTAIVFTNNTGSGSPGFVTNTTSTTSTNVVYPWANFAFQANGAFQMNFKMNASAASTSTNITVYLAHSVDGVWTNLTTNGNVVAWTFPVIAGTAWQCDETNFTGLGDGWWAPLAFYSSDTNVADYPTNVIFQTAVKKLPR